MFAGTALGFDFGGRRIGVAVGQSITQTASPLAVIANTANGPDWPELDKLVRAWRPNALVVGLPLSVEGFDQPMTTAAREFGQTLAARYGIEVQFQDERYSSRESESAFKQLRQAGLARRKDAGKLDAEAARRILERWLTQLPVEIRS